MELSLLSNVSQSKILERAQAEKGGKFLIVLWGLGIFLNISICELSLVEIIQLLRAQRLLPPPLGR
jgi:hypothetical protein